MAEINRCCLLLVVSFIWPGILHAQKAAGNQRIEIPKFEDYPVAEKWTGPGAPVKLTSPLERLFRTNLREAAKQPPNFAGHYRVTEWGCGTRCAGGVIVNLQTGGVYPLPLAGRGRGEEYWIFCVSLPDGGGMATRPDSRLMIIRCGLRGDDEGNPTPDEYYFVWENDHFHRLLYIRGSGKHDLARNRAEQISG